MRFKKYIYNFLNFVMLLPVSKTGYQIIQDMKCTNIVCKKYEFELPQSTLNTPNNGIFLIFLFFSSTKFNKFWYKLS